MASGTASKEYKLAVKIAGSISSSFNNSMGEASGKFTELGNAAKAAAAVAAAAWGALQIGQFIADATDTYIGFEQAMANTSAIAGATGEEYDALREAALEMGKATSKTAAESADALGYMALAGWSVNDSIASLEPILRLSEATGMDLARCSDLVTDSVSALGLEVQDLSGYLDVAAQANNKSNQTAEMLMEAYIGVGGTLKNLNIPIQQSSAALGVMANRGIKGSEAGNALNAVLVNLTTGTGQAGKMMEKLGISAFDSSGNFIGLQETIQAVYEATKDMTEAERNAAIAAIGGKQHADALNALMAGLTTTTADGATEWNALADALYNSDGAMATMAATVTDTWEGAKARLDSAIDDLKINLVSTFAPYAKNAINGVAEYIPRITEGITTAAQAFIDNALPKIVAFKDRAVELFGMASEGIGRVVSEHSSTFEKLGELGSRLGAIFADIQAKAQPVLDYIFSTGIPNVVDGLLTIVEKLADLGLFLTEHKKLVVAVVAAYAAFKGITALSDLGNKISTATRTLEAFQQVTNGTSLVTFAKTGLTTLKTGILGIGGAIKGIAASVGAFLAANPIVLIIAGIVAVVAAVVTLYKKCEWFRNGVNAIIASIVGFFENAATKISVVFTGLWERLGSVGSLGSMFTGIKTILEDIIGFIQNIFAGNWSAAWQNILGIAQGFLTTMVSAATLPMDLLLTGIQNGINAVGAFLQEKMPFLGAIFTDWASSISAAIDNVKAIFSSIIDFIQNVFAGNWSAAWQNIQDIFGNLFGAIVNLAKAPINGVISAINFVLQKINGISVEIPDWVPVVGGQTLGFNLPTIPQLAKGGIVDNPTILEAGEAGTEAIIPLPELWNQMQGIFDNSVSGLSDKIASLAETLNAADIGNRVTPLSDLLGRFGGGNDDEPDPDGDGGITIYYQPVYHFEGGAPDQDDLTNAEHMSQEEFERRMDLYLKNRRRKDF